MPTHESSFWLTAMPVIVPAATALVGSILGALFAPFLTFRLNEKVRRLEFSKIVYPQKLEIVKKAMDDGVELILVLKVMLTADPDDNAKEVMRLEVSKWMTAVIKADWMLGQNFSQKCMDFQKACNGFVDDVSNVNFSSAWFAFSQMGAAAHQEMQLPEIYNVLDSPSV